VGDLQIPRTRGPLLASVSGHVNRAGQIRSRNNRDLSEMITRRKGNARRCERPL
jgi:hypothetical protein